MGTEGSGVTDFEPLDESIRFVLEAAGIGWWLLDMSTNTTTRSLLHDQMFGYTEMLPSWSYETVESITSAVDSTASSWAMRPSVKLCSSRAAWYSAFSFRSPWARASAIAAMMRGRSVDFSYSSSARRRSEPALVIGGRLMR